MSTLIAGISIGGITGAALFLGEVSITGATTTVNLRDSLAVGLTVCGMVWWMGRKFQSIEDELKQSGIERAKIRDDLEKIKKRLDCDKDEE